MEAGKGLLRSGIDVRNAGQFARASKYSSFVTPAFPKPARVAAFAGLVVTHPPVRR
jgi:hypothetical protein